MYAHKQLIETQGKHCAVSPDVSPQGETDGVIMMVDRSNRGVDMRHSAEEFDINSVLSQLGYRVVVLDADDFEAAIAAMDGE